MGKLYEKLKNYGKDDYYGFHMPGHKRNTDKLGWENPFEIDITEIEGFDNLHHARGILEETNKRAARLYGSEETLMSVGGSTACLLSAVSGTASRRGKILMARNCHKAVYHGVYLGEMEAEYLYPETENEYNLNGGIRPEQVKERLEADSKIEAVLITSPTYEGFCSDVKEIVGICHTHYVPLIVDQAHGAHFGFADFFPESAVSQGADVVINSLHKTLPALTQTALIHLNGSLIDRERIKKYMGIYQSSSPSYVLMGSIDYCLDFLEQEKSTFFEQYKERIKSFRERAGKLENIRLADNKIKGTAGIYDVDCSKLVFSLRGTNMSGQQLYRKLLEEYQLQMELVSSDFVVGISTIMDEDNGFLRLIEALEKIDPQIYKKPETGSRTGQVRNEKIFTLAGADQHHMEKINVYYAEERISGSYVYLYPPGIPLLVPGEKIGAALLETFTHYQNSGLSLEGLNDDGEIYILTKYKG